MRLLSKIPLFAGHNGYLFEVISLDPKDIGGTALQITLLVKGHRETQDPPVIFGLSHVLEDFFSSQLIGLGRLVDGRQQYIHRFISGRTETADRAVLGLEFLDVVGCLRSFVLEPIK